MGQNDIFWEIVRENLPDKQIRNYVVIAEIIEEDGPRLALIFNDGLTPWTATGMIEYALRTIDEDGFNGREGND